MPHTRVSRVNVQETEGGPRARALEIPLWPFSDVRARRGERERKRKREKEGKKE